MTENEQNELVELYQLNTEYSQLSKLDHPLICELLEVYVDRNFLYFVHPFYPGGDLNDQMKMKKIKNINDTKLNYTQYSIDDMSSSEESEEEDNENAKPLPEYVVKVLVYQALRTLNYLHNNNIAHRDIKPDNIMLEYYQNMISDDQDLQTNFIRLIDFGYAVDLNCPLSEPL